MTRSFLQKNVIRPHEQLYTRLKPSKIHGVGVLAVRRIKKGSLLFSGDRTEDESKTATLVITAGKLRSDLMAVLCEKVSDPQTLAKLCPNF